MPAIPTDLYPVIDLTAGYTWLDLSSDHAADAPPDYYRTISSFTTYIDSLLANAKVPFGLGGYGEDRPFYRTNDFGVPTPNGYRYRSVHLGIDVWCPAGTPVRCPYPARVHSVAVDPTDNGYGPVLILEHAAEYPADRFYTLYGHLDAEVLVRYAGATRVDHSPGRGQSLPVISAGATVAYIGGPTGNGGWPPHLHFQVMHKLLDERATEFPGVAFPAEAPLWLKRCPDPASFFGLAASPRQPKP